MPATLKKGDKGAQVSEIQKLLVERGYQVGIDYRAVRAFQSQNLDQHGQSLVVDGKVGSLTWWSLTNPKPVIVTPSAIDYQEWPPVEMGGSVCLQQDGEAAGVRACAVKGDE